MTNILFNVERTGIAPITHDNDYEFEAGMVEEGNYALVIGDLADTAALVGSLDELDEMIGRMRVEVAKLRRYDKTLQRAKARLLE